MALKYLEPSAERCAVVPAALLVSESGEGLAIGITQPALGML
jgi:hypothetical protein